MFWGPSKSGGPMPMASMALWMIQHCRQTDIATYKPAIAAKKNFQKGNCNKDKNFSSKILKNLLIALFMKAPDHAKLLRAKAHSLRAIFFSCEPSVFTILHGTTLL